jgi:hypothetical protein
VLIDAQFNLPRRENAAYMKVSGLSFITWVVVACLQARAQEDVVRVGTADELIHAVTTGSRHIVITEHMDLRQYRKFNPDIADSFLGVLSPGPATKSIRVRTPGSHSHLSCSRI